MSNANGTPIHLYDPLQQAVRQDALVVLGREHLHGGAREVVVEHAVRPLRPRLQGLPDGQGAEEEEEEEGNVSRAKKTIIIQFDRYFWDELWLM